MKHTVIHQRMGRIQDFLHGLYAMPLLLGGPSNTLFASIIGQVFAKAGDSWPQGSAFSIILVGASLAVVGIFIALFQDRRRRRA